MRQLTLDEPQTTEAVLLALSRLGWDQLGSRKSGLTVLYTLRKGNTEREIDEEDLAQFLAAGAPSLDAVTAFAVLCALDQGEASLAELRRRLSGYDCTGLKKIVDSLIAEGELIHDGRVFRSMEPEL